MMVWIKSFVAAFLATLVFHQGVFGVMYLAGMVPAPPFNLESTPPLGVPAVVSLAFWGGLWGLPLWAVVRRMGDVGYWGLSLLFGALLPTAVAMLVVFPLKGMEVSVATWIGGFILNGAWGIGTALFMVLMGARRPPADEL
ncbi:hypothetical protein ACMDCT_07780 [Halomonadaceae bacterium KBTZ08]